MPLAVKKPATALGLAWYPKDADGMAELTTHVLTRSRQHDTASDTTLYVVSNDVRADLGPYEYPESIRSTAGVVLVFDDVPDDMVFYVAAAFRADAFIKHLGASGKKHLFAIWNRFVGLTAISSDGEDVAGLPRKTVEHFLPDSLREETRQSPN